MPNPAHGASGARPPAEGLLCCVLGPLASVSTPALACGRVGGGQTEWAEVGPGLVLIATGDRAWLHRLSPGDLFAHPKVGLGSLEAVGTLLDGAIGLFQHQRLRASAPPLTVEAYIERVAACYYGGRATPPLLRRAAERFSAAGRDDLARWASTTARAEDHDHLALADLEELGYPAELVETIPCPPTMQAAIGYFEGCVEGAHPVSCLGYVYALERPAALVEASYVEAIEKLLGPTLKATRCLRWHSSLGEEPHHIDILLRVIAGLPAEDRVAVARAVYETARIMFADAAAGGDDAPEPQSSTRTY
jgi:hypothetical protein